jgi:hypothetical protein
MGRKIPASGSRADFGIEEFSWDPAAPEQSLQLAYASETDFARNKIYWYFDEAKKHEKLSKRIRALALVLFVLGGLCPLIDATGYVPGWRLPSWGYVTIALAAGIFYWDRIHGASSTWRRDTLTWIAIRRLLKDFQYDWVLPRGGESTARVERLKAFRQNVEAVIENEAKVWVAEDEQALNELAARFPAQPGSTTRR